MFGSKEFNFHYKPNNKQTQIMTKKKPIRSVFMWAFRSEGNQMLPRHPPLPEWFSIASRQPNDSVGKTTLRIWINKISIPLPSVNDIHVT